MIIGTSAEETLIYWYYSHQVTKEMRYLVTVHCLKKQDRPQTLAFHRINFHSSTVVRFSLGFFAGWVNSTGGSSRPHI